MNNENSCLLSRLEKSIRKRFFRVCVVNVLIKIIFSLVESCYQLFILVSQLGEKNEFCRCDHQYFYTSGETLVESIPVEQNE